MRRTPTWLAITLAPVLGFLARYRAHPAHAFDPETSLAATAGREFAHGMLPWLPHYQINLHQGSQLFDAVLAMVGFLLFGDHTLAWGVVGLFWLAVTALSGASVLRRVAGWPAAVAFSALLTTAPFVIKDGMMALSGGHPPVVGWLLASLALAVQARPSEAPGLRGPSEEARRQRFAFAAAALAGLGAWYTRSVVLALPVVVLTVARGWSGGPPLDELRRLPRDRGLRAALLGSLVLPAALVGQVALHAAAGTHLSGDDRFLQKTLNPIVNMDDCSDYEIEQGLCDQDRSLASLRLKKTAEAVGGPFTRWQFGQPEPVVAATPRTLQPAADVVGPLWVAAWTLGLLGFLAYGLRGRLDRIGWMLAALPTGYLYAYVFTGMRVEDTESAWWPEIAVPPPPTNLRYLIPLWILMLATSSGTFGLLWQRGGVRRFGAAAGLLLLVVPGATLSLLDATKEADPPAVFDQHLPFRYLRNYAAHRGPPRDAHRVCGHDDPISRANHLRSFTSWTECDLDCLVQDPGRLRETLDWLLSESAENCPSAFTEADAAFVLHGFGVGIGAAGQFWEARGVREMANLAWVLAESMTEEEARWFLLGVADALWDHGEPMSIPDQLLLFCREAPKGGRPLCPLVGSRVCEPGDPPSPDPATVCTNLDAPVLPDLQPDVALELVRGAGRAAGWRAPLEAAQPDLSSWPPAWQAAFLDGWRTGGRFRWSGAEEAPYRPDRVP